MKKFITLLLVLVMLMAFAPAAFGVGVGSHQELVIGENEVIYSLDNGPTLVVWTAEEPGTLTLDFSDDDTGRLWCNIFNPTADEDVYIETTGGSGSIEVAAGDQLIITIAEATDKDAVFHFVASFEPGEGRDTSQDRDCEHNSIVRGQDYCYEDETMYDLVEYCYDCGQVFNRYLPGEVENPILVPFEYNEAQTEATATVTVPAGQTMWFGQTNIAGMMLDVNGEQYGTMMPDPLNFWGPCVFSLTNDTAEDATYELRLYWVLGAEFNPDELIIDESFQLSLPENSDYYYLQWIATESGKLTLVVDGENWVYTVDDLGDPNNYDDDEYGDSFYAKDGDSNTYVLWVEAGDCIRVRFSAMDVNFEFPAIDLTITATFTPGVGPGETVLPAVLGDNSMADGKYEFVAAQAGKLYFRVTMLTSQYGEVTDPFREYFGDKVLLYINDEPVANGYFGALDVAEGDVVSFEWVSTTYTAYYGTLNLSYEDNNPALGSQERPIELDPDVLPTTIELAPGATTWFELDYDLSESMLTILGEGAFVRYTYLDFDLGSEVVKTIEAVDGVITLQVDDLPVMLIEVGNAGTETAVFELTLEVPEEGCKHENVEHFEAAEAQCHFAGNLEYWFCPECLCIFTDAELTVTSSIEAVTIPGDRSHIEYVEGYEAGCHQNGLKEFWHCTECMVVYADEALSIVTNTASQVIPYDAENIEYVPYLAPTEETSGHKEYWHCKECDCVFADAALTTVTNIKYLTVLYQDVSNTGDIFTVVLAAALFSGTGIVVLSKKRK